MMPPPRGAEIYRRIDTQTRSPMELVVMLYDGALRFVGEARAAASRNDLRTRAEATSRAIAIVSELQNTLRVDEGGDIARELDRLYTYINTRLLDVAAKHDITALDEVHKLLSTLREGWSEVAARGAAR
jgi:flagellar protein FliS